MDQNFSAKDLLIGQEVEWLPTNQTRLGSKAVWQRGTVKSLPVFISYLATELALSGAISGSATYVALGTAVLYLRKNSIPGSKRGDRRPRKGVGCAELGDCETRRGQIWLAHTSGGVNCETG